MKANTLISIQLTSLILITGTAENFLRAIYPSIIFALAFISFAICSIYIGRHEKELTAEEEAADETNGRESHPAAKK